MSPATPPAPRSAGRARSGAAAQARLAPPRRVDPAQVFLGCAFVREGLLR
jgi:hypothetical protein